MKTKFVVICGLSAAALLTSGLTQAEDRVVKDQVKGALVWRPYSNPVSWRGDVDARGFAHGAGVLSVYDHQGALVAEFSGTMANGKLQGEVSAKYLRSPDRVGYVGEFSDWSENGNGTMTYKNGRKVSGRWKEGELVAEDDAAGEKEPAEPAAGVAEARVDRLAGDVEEDDIEWEEVVRRDTPEAYIRYWKGHRSSPHLKVFAGTLVTSIKGDQRGFQAIALRMPEHPGFVAELEAKKAARLGVIEFTNLGAFSKFGTKPPLKNATVLLDSDGDVVAVHLEGKGNTDTTVDKNSAVYEVFEVKNVPVSDRLNVRAGPAVGTNTVFKLANGERVLVVGPAAMNGTTEWVPILADERRGWVSKRFLSATGDTQQVVLDGEATRPQPGGDQATSPGDRLLGTAPIRASGHGKVKSFGINEHGQVEFEYEASGEGLLHNEKK